MTKQTEIQDKKRIEKIIENEIKLLQANSQSIVNFIAKFDHNSTFFIFPTVFLKWAGHVFDGEDDYSQEMSKKIIPICLSLSAAGLLIYLSESLKDENLSKEELMDLVNNYIKEVVKNESI